MAGGGRGLRTGGTGLAGSMAGRGDGVAWVAGGGIVRLFTRDSMDSFTSTPSAFKIVSPAPCPMAIIGHMLSQQFPTEGSGAFQKGLNFAVVLLIDGRDQLAKLILIGM
jgi:hypothetical protein